MSCAHCGECYACRQKAATRAVLTASVHRKEADARLAERLYRDGETLSTVALKLGVLRPTVAAWLTARGVPQLPLDCELSRTGRARLIAELSGRVVLA